MAYKVIRDELQTNFVGLNRYRIISLMKMADVIVLTVTYVESSEIRVRKIVVFCIMHSSGRGAGHGVTEALWACELWSESSAVWMKRHMEQYEHCVALYCGARIGVWIYLIEDYLRKQWSFRGNGALRISVQSDMWYQASCSVSVGECAGAGYAGCRS